jgi:hypothetical protein
MSHPVVSSAFFIFSRTLLYAALWFVLSAARDYLRAEGAFRLRLSPGDILFYLFAGWFFALLSWRVGGDKKSRSE